MADINRTELNLPKCSVVVKGNDPDIRALAERVDKTLVELENQMKNFKAADASEISGVPASSVVSGSMAMYFQTFEDDITQNWIFNDGLATDVSFTNNGRTGGRALRTTNASLDMEDNTFIPFDESRLYRIRTRYRDISGVHRQVYVGVRCYDENYALIGTTQRVAVFDSSNSSTSWTTVTGYFKDATSGSDVATPSTDPSAPRAIRIGTRYIRPYFHLSAGGDDQIAEIDYITLEILTETPETNELLTTAGGRAVTDLASTVKSGGGVADNQVGNSAVQQYALQADRMDTLTGGGLTINFRATGTQKVFEHTNFYIQADGTAVFAGIVAATSFTGATATFTGSVNIYGGTGETVAALGHVASYGGKIDLRTTISSKSQWRMLNYGDNNLTFEQLTGEDYDGDVLFLDAAVKSAHAFYAYGSLTSDQNSNLLDAFDADGHPYNFVKTNNTSATTYVRFSSNTGMQAGHWCFVYIGDSNTTFDFSTGTYLKGNGGVDYSPSNGEVMLFLCTTGYSGNVWTWVNNP